jgi:hypothetical protein
LGRRPASINQRTNADIPHFAGDGKNGDKKWGHAAFFEKPECPHFSASIEKLCIKRIPEKSGMPPFFCPGRPRRLGG